MTKPSASLLLVVLTTMIFNPSLRAQNVGIGTTVPDYRLHVLNTGSSLLKLEHSVALGSGVTNDLFFKTGTLYTAGIRTIGTSTLNARLGFFTKASATESGLIERLTILDNGYVGLGTTLPLSPLHIVSANSNPMIIDGASSMYITLNEGGTSRGYLGSFAGNPEDIDFGTYISNTTGKVHLTIRDNPALTVDANGDVGIGTTTPAYSLHVIDNGSSTGVFENISTTGNNVGVNGKSNVSAGHGTGVWGVGGNIGVEADANLVGVNDRYGVTASASGGGGTNSGVFSYASGGVTAYGVFGGASGASFSNWAGYFQGAVFGTSYTTSDRKLKDNIQPLQNATSIIDKLNPTFYNFRTKEYAEMNLPEGIHYGLIADEVQSVLPGIIKKAVQPPQFENNNIHGRKVKDEVEFNAISYTEIIPILVGAVKEQQAVINDQKKRIDELEKNLEILEKKLGIR